MKHTEGFLKLVNEARGRIREVTVEETLKRLSSGEAELEAGGCWQRWAGVGYWRGCFGRKRVC